MSLDAGQQLLHYRLTEKIGEGGMGVVWNARDTTLDRDVAIKVLPASVSGSTERLARFEREAKTLAQLNHPNIAAIYGMHEDRDLHFLAMELVSGENLAERIQRDPMRVEQALEACIQIAEALEAAHAAGIIHRDLKPANVQITDEGRIKVLDFGLAKIFDNSSQSGSQVDLSLSPTVTSAGTIEGMLLGTAAYMSPEQARGRAIDKRTDIWAFGCVLWECLTGKTIFRGESVSDSIGAILHRDPDESELPAETPPLVRLLIKRCLTRKREQRLHDIADARIELQAALEDPTGESLGLTPTAVEQPTGTRRPVAALLVAAALVVGMVVGSSWLSRETPEPPLRKFDLGNWDVADPTPDGTVAISPDATQVVFGYQDSLWLQTFDTIEPRQLSGTEGARAPFWSPDGESIGYFEGAKLWKYSVTSGSKMLISTIDSIGNAGVGAVWGDENRIFLTSGSGGIDTVSAGGGEAVEHIPAPEALGDYHPPVLLPDGRSLVAVLHPSNASYGKLVAVDADKKVTQIYDAGASSRIRGIAYSPTGHLLFRLSSATVTHGLWALPFSAESLEVTGEPFLVAEGGGSPSIARDGTLVYIHRPPVGRLGYVAKLDRSGRELEQLTDVVAFAFSPNLSPDGKKLAVSIDDGEVGPEVYVVDLERGTQTQLSDADTTAAFPFWIDDDRLIYTEFMNFESFVAEADGSTPPVPLGAGVVLGSSLDGEHVVLHSSENMFANIVEISIEDPSSVVNVVSPPFEMIFAFLSPDHRHILYQSGDSVPRETFVSPFPSLDRRWSLSRGGGSPAGWSQDGRLLYFTDSDQQLFEVSFNGAGDRPEIGVPQRLFKMPQLDFGVHAISTKSGDEIISFVLSPVESFESRRSGIKIVQNWFAEFSSRAD